jgi:hypothetical protein
MAGPPNPWTSLEVAKLMIGVLTPMSVAVLGALISRHMKRLDLAQWTNQKIIEKRIAVYDAIAPELNKLLCFHGFIGYWKTVSPVDMIEAKRELDKKVNIYRHVFEDDVYESYQKFIHALFETYTEKGHDAKILALIEGIDGDRKTDCAFEWKEEWSALFLPHKAKPRNEIREIYLVLMSALTKSLGVKRGG